MITLTINALKELKCIMSDQNMDLNKVHLRVRTVGNGCSGLTYKLDLDEEIDEDDKLDSCDGIKIAIDKRSVLYTEGLIVDWHYDKKAFSAISLNQKSTCGCNSAYS
jgi:iron-sulfur cluster assembly protein